MYLESKKTRQLQENGFYVDIFPYDFVPEDEGHRRANAGELLNIYRVKLMKSRYQPWMDEDRIVWKKRIGYLYYQIQSLFINQEDLARSYDNLATSVLDSNLMGGLSWMPKPHYFPSRIFTEFADYSFEGETFRGLKDYDTYLKVMYDDYMQLPPEDQRENRHQIIQIDFGDEKE